MSLVRQRIIWCNEMQLGTAKVWETILHHQNRVKNYLITINFKKILLFLN